MTCVFSLSHILEACCKICLQKIGFLTQFLLILDFYFLSLLRCALFFFLTICNLGFFRTEARQVKINFAVFSYVVCAAPWDFIINTNKKNQTQHCRALAFQNAPRVNKMSI